MSNPRQRAHFPATKQCFPNRGARPIPPAPWGAHPPAAVRSPHPDGIESRREAQLPCRDAISTISTCERASSSTLLIHRIQDQADRAGERPPFRLFDTELFPAGRREAIVPGALAFVGEFPGSGDPAFRFETMESRVQRTGLDLEQVLRGSLNVFRDGVAVRASAQQGAEDEEIERALQKIHARRLIEAHCVASLLSFM